MKRFLIILAVAAGIATGARAAGLSDVQAALQSGYVQEKVFVHMDNNCYFARDTIWYKAYVVRADDLCPTDMSRILYVELLSPDGFLVERQHILISGVGFTCGQFALPDSLYSGYYEIRAYTRYMLNFNVERHAYKKRDTYNFYSSLMAADYFRTFPGLYSRVFPVYLKPEEAGAWGTKQIQARPRQRIAEKVSPTLNCTFFPEGGHLVEGIPCRVAFELTNEVGAAVEGEGTEYMGRGTFEITPTATRTTKTFTYGGKEYTFKLPEAEKAGATIRYDNGAVDITTKNLPAGQYAIAITCRGALQLFEEIDPTVRAHIDIPMEQLYAGVHDISLIDEQGHILASRLFFVQPTTKDTSAVTITTAKSDYDPYEQVDIDLQLSSTTAPSLLSVAVTDAAYEDPSYNTGDMMTDLLLGSELRGFIADPNHYFDPTVAERERHTDLLMMVQGWRRYKLNTTANDTTQLRYEPETTMTVEGHVYKFVDVVDVEEEDIASLSNGVAKFGVASDEDDSSDSDTDSDTDSDSSTETETMESGSVIDAMWSTGMHENGLKYEVNVHAELIHGDGEVLAGEQLTTDGGHFTIALDPYYGDAILKLSAIKPGKEEKNKTFALETAYPAYYVKRDLFFPIYTEKYNYYQTHQPENYKLSVMGTTPSGLSMEDEVYELDDVSVNGKRRGKRAIDFIAPVYTIDAHEMYNLLTDYGLSYGMYIRRDFAYKIARFLYGNMGRTNRFNVDGRLDRYTYYRSYTPDENNANKQWDNRSNNELFTNTQLKRIDEIRVYSDFEPRNEYMPKETDSYNADVTVELVNVPDDAVRPTFRDRHIILHGFNMNADFYSPDYSAQQPATPTDYRRTLYWNPNAVTDANGHLHLTLFNNSKDTRIKITVAGITCDGKIAAQ